MKKLALILLALCICGAAGAVTLFKYKAPAYYMDQVIDVINNPSASAGDVERAFECLDKVRTYVKDRELIVQRSDELVEASEKKGHIQSRELQLKLIRRIISEEPGNWNARELLIKSLAERGDLAGLASEAAELDKLIRDRDEDWNYCVRTAQLFTVASSVPWFESEAYLSLNKSPASFIEKTAVYTQAVQKTSDLKQELVAMLGADAALKKVPPASLVSAAEIAAEEVLSASDQIHRAEKFNQRMENDENFRKAVTFALEGNVALANKKYPDARAKYRSALSIMPLFPDARKQAAETDFQEGVFLLAAESSQNEARRLLNGAYESLGELVDEADAYGPQFPFVDRDRFSGEAWCLKAAVISAMRASYSQNNRKIKALEKEFRESLDEALKLNPNSRLAKDMLDRYTKEGF